MASKRKAKKPGRVRTKAAKAKAARRPPKKARVRRRAKPARAARAAPARAPAGQSEGAVARAWRTVLDTFTGTGKLRSKLEQRGTSETE